MFETLDYDTLEGGMGLPKIPSALKNFMPAMFPAPPIPKMLADKIPIFKQMKLPVMPGMPKLPAMPGMPAPPGGKLGDDDADIEEIFGLPDIDGVFEEEGELGEYDLEPLGDEVDIDTYGIEAGGSQIPEITYGID